MSHVVGSQFSQRGGKAWFEWWDANVQVKWVGEDTWENEAYFDKNVEGWVSKPRGDFSCYWIRQCMQAMTCELLLGSINRQTQVVPACNKITISRSLI